MRDLEEIFTWARCFSRKDLCRLRSISFSDFGNSPLLLISCRSTWKLCKLSCAVGQVHENRTVDSAAFHKERLFRCVDDITFLPVGPYSYIVNIRAGGAHFSDEILRKNRHFDVIHVCNSTYWQQQRCAIRGRSIYFSCVCIFHIKIRITKKIPFHTLYSVSILCTV